MIDDNSKIGPNPSGLCWCGCGARAPIATRHDPRHGHVRGKPLKYVLGHRSKRWVPDESPRECACGCGELTTVYRGNAKKFVHGHNHEERYISAKDYTVEDRGYETPCWIWRHATNKNRSGHGAVTIRKRKTTAHRAMYEQKVGPIPRGRVLHHLCEVTACIRPSHLAVLASQSAHNRVHGFGGRNRRRDLDDSSPEIIRLYYAVGWTQAEIATRFETSNSVVGRIVRGERLTTQPPRITLDVE